MLETNSKGKLGRTEIGQKKNNIPGRGERNSATCAVTKVLGTEE